MDEIVKVLLKIIKFMQVIIVLASVASFIYLGILTYSKKFDKVKEYLPWILLGLIILLASYSIPVIILSFLEIKTIP